MIRIIRLNPEPSRPCFLVSINDVRLICDCADIFANKVKASNASDLAIDALDDVDDVEWSLVDAILVSNSYSLIMLPYITELRNFRGKVLVPDPILRLGKVLIDDIFAETENLSSNILESIEKSQRWLLGYTKAQAANALSKVQTLAYHEYVDLFGLIKVKCVSAGYEVGSSNWIFKTETEKVAYISRSSLHPSFAMPMDFSEFSDVDVLIVGAVNTSKCLPFGTAMELFKTVTIQTLARGGHVMIPILPSGLIYHLLEAVASAKEEFDGNLLTEFDKLTLASSADTTVAAVGDKAAPRGGVSLVGEVAKCPCLFISSQAKASLAYANASGEWLAADRESALYVAESPFRFDTWIRNGHLATLPSLHSTPGQQTSGGEKAGVGWAEGGLWPSYPIVFVAGHPSCRLGPALHLIRMLSLGAGRRQPPQQHQLQQFSNLNALILVQSDEFVRGNLDGHDQLQWLLKPLRGSGDVATYQSGNETIRGLPVCRFGVGLTAYWLPLRSDISTIELPTLLAKCGPPNQALLVPLEVFRGLKASPSMNVKGIGYKQCLDVQLEAPSMIRVHVEPEVLSSSCAFALASESSATGTTTSASDASHRTHGTPTHVALAEGQLFYRDGRYRLQPMEPDEFIVTGDKASLPRSTNSPPQSPKRSSSPSPIVATSAITSTEAVGAYRFLLTSTSESVVVDANKLVKHLTESGVTGAQVITDANLLESFLASHRCLHRRLPPHLLPPIEATAKSIALVVIPNSTTTILLTEGGSHITCQDEGTRLAIRNSLLACAPHLLAVPAAGVPPN